MSAIASLAGWRKHSRHCVRQLLPWSLVVLFFANPPLRALRSFTPACASRDQPALDQREHTPSRLLFSPTLLHTGRYGEGTRFHTSAGTAA